MKKIFSIIFIVLILLSLVSCKNSSDKLDLENIENNILAWPSFQKYDEITDTNVKNIILLIGDGMGENTIKDAAIVKGENLLMQGITHSTYVTTDSLDGTTDSAASATAISCGVKTHNKYIGVDGDANDVESICEFATAREMKTGLVATQIINHATPAGMVAHTDYRELFNQILKQEINAGVDVMFGGGSEYHTKNIQKRLDKNNYKYIDNIGELEALTLSEGEKALGMFSYNAIYATQEKAPTLAKMTQKALDLLDNENGFFLMVEGSNIDVQISNIDMDGAMLEMESFDQAIKVALDYASKNEGTLVLVTADHETGGIKYDPSYKKEDITNDLITSEGNHTSTNVLLYAYGARADVITEKDLIYNTDISKYMRQLLNETYGEKPPLLLNHNLDLDGDPPLNENSDAE